jgi:hypothetical protein
MGGSGLGLYHAHNSIKSWGGRLNIVSQLGKGTQVTITLPKVAAPAWFVNELAFVPGSTIAVLDDDESIHRIWRGHAESAHLSDYSIKLLHLSTPAELRDICKDNTETVRPGKDATTYLVDYELLGFNETGLDLIEELGIAAQSSLVTSRYEEPAIRERCLRLKVRLIPKGIAGFVPIRVINRTTLNGITPKLARHNRGAIRFSPTSGVRPYAGQVRASHLRTGVDPVS